MRLIFKISIILGIVIIVGLGIYLGWNKIVSPKNPNDNNPPPVQNQNSDNTEKIKKVSENSVFDFWVVPDTGEVYYFTPEGKIFGAKDGPDLEISSQAINALNFIEAAPKNQKILAAFGNPRAPEWGIFDLIDKVWRPLPADILNATWGGRDDELMAVLKNQNDFNLAKMDLSKNPPANKTLIKDFRFSDIRLKFVSPDKFFITELPSGSYSGRVWQLDLKTLNFNLLIAPEKGLTISWSDDKNIAFKFSAPNKFLFLDGKNLSGLTQAIFLTMPEKCNGEAAASATTEIYCFVPQDIISSQINLPDDYFQNKFFAADDLFALKINPETKELNEIKNPFRSGENGLVFDGVKPKILNDKLYFINRLDGYLYEFLISKS